MTPPETVRELKRSVRRELSARRKALPTAEVDRQNSEIIAHARELLRGLPEPRLRIAAYHAGEREPGGKLLVDSLYGDGHEVLLPISGERGELTWARYQGPEATAPGRLGISEPTGERLGTDALAECAVIFVPALGVTPGGVRMGKGGGYYDRTLSQLPDNGPLTVVLLYDAEITDTIPTEAHDFGVAAAITPRGLMSFPGNQDDLSPV
ncbi:5-formyltetrahydrofolate cyclo-ligase [Corynebacterium doosanense]|uniref:5-formyltetrahydrofolate cyclo-ligase n=1 Tax=Corynebacterium doosanense TaxID=1121358 RepID=UPI0003A78C78|nr:5-formyltetrahydrofolate cyclo-ligase [Corynebacterium doosanense]